MRSPIPFLHFHTYIWSMAGQKKAKEGRRKGNRRTGAKTGQDGVATRALEAVYDAKMWKALHCLPGERSLKLKSNYNE